MGFFDLNIPFSESSSSTVFALSPASKAARVKLATAAMEFGYTGVAYNHTIRGIMSERDRCTITPLTLASLLKLSPSLSSSVQFHRELVGVPRASPFRQYTRLTVVVDSLAQSHALNSGNPILKTYDFVSVKPLNQAVFDHACERSEVDIIAIDFAEKLPFRLKLPMVKAAIKRGVYFEITYSGLLADIQSRRQMVANAKLLVDWTRGKNLIISSAASTVYELRGPYDVANLSFLLGLSMERAKAALSKNCRALITKTLRKKQFHKEAVKVELTSPGEQVSFGQPWSSDFLKWDPISSGDCDILLEDLAKSFDAASKVSKNVKAIDFTSVIDNDQSRGFQLKDVISDDKLVSDSQSLDNSRNANFIAKETELSVSSDRKLLQTSGLDLPTPSKQEAFGNQNSRILYPCNTTKPLSTAVVMGGLTTPMEEEASDISQSTVNTGLIRAPIHGFQLQRCDNIDKSNAGSPNEKLRDFSSDKSASGVDSKRVQTCTTTQDRNLLTPTEEEDLRTDYETQETIGDYLMDVDLTVNGKLDTIQKDPLQDHVPIQEFNTVTIKHNPLAGNNEPQNTTAEDQINVVTVVQSTPGKSKAKRKRPRQQALFPFKLKLSPSSFKKPRKSTKKKKTH